MQVPTTTDEYTVTHDDQQLRLSREERKILTYLVDVMDGEPARQSDVVDFSNISKSDASRLRGRMKDKGLVEDMTLKGENDGTPLNDPVAWEATDKANRLAGTVSLATDEMTLAERVTLVEQSIGELAVRADDDGVSEDLEKLQRDMARLTKEVERHQRTVNHLKKAIHALLRQADDLPDDTVELIRESDDFSLQ